MASSFLSAFIFEIPTGAIADLYGRKLSVLIGYSIEAIGFLSLFFIDGFYPIMFALILVGFGSTFSSGAKEAWVIDLVKKKKGLDKEYFVKSQSFDNSALLISGFIGAFVVGMYGLKSIWLVAFFSFLISIFVLIFADEKYSKKKRSVRDSYKEIKDQTKISVKYSSKHPVLFWIFVAGFILIFSTAFSDGLTWTPFLQELGFPDYAFGYLWSAIAGLSIFSPWVSKKFLKSDTEKSQRNFIAGGILITSLITFLVLFANNLIFALGITLSSVFVYASLHPVERCYFHRFIPTKLRATIGSVEAMIATLAIIISYPIIGLMVDLIGPRYTIAIGSVLALPSAIIYYQIKDFKK